MSAQTMVERRSSATKRARMAHATKSRKGCPCFNPQPPDAITNCAKRAGIEDLIYKEHSMPLREVYRLLFLVPRDDENLRFYNKTADESRCLLWAICTHPLVDARFTYPAMLGSIAEQTFHYGIKPLQHWAMDAIHIITRPPSTVLRTCPVDAMAYLSRAALAYYEPPLLDLITDHWINRLLLPQSPHALPPEDAIVYGEHTSQLMLQAAASYAYMIRDLPTIAADVKARAIRPKPPLNGILQRHVLAGYKSLSVVAARLRAAPPPYPRAEECTEEEHWKCERVWGRAWHAVAGDMNVDVINRLATAQAILRRDARLARVMNDACREAAFAALRKARMDTLKHLPHHFDL
ncbi:hypothetical protein BD626DRAFT_401631 [Schizophyllum amplum]|uniref:Uncharacterized protein n=1 Tax=Schizophyllum amplum TaxID=97359 RepID=A0A550CGG6_9AGAR|nr:hypothetical protein BD626DRAFT_401631 [Auriculariopsis ampla]